MMIRTCLPKSIILFCFCLISSVIYAQEISRNITDLKSQAIGNFETGNYPESYEQYKILLSRYPKDGIYSYYCGLSLLNMNKDIPKAIGFLEFSSSKATVPSKVLYYLGDAYTRNYEFSKAKEAFDKFSTVASKSEEKELKPSRHSEMSENAISLTGSYNNIDVLASSLFTFSDSGYIMQLQTPGGSLSIKPADLSPASNGLKDISNLMFIPRKAEKGDFVFYAGYGNNRKRGTDIFMVKAGNHNKYTEPIAVEAINTEYDEIMPYYDPIGKDLIFASRGHNSMGGFDLFKSHYNSEKNTWTPPVSLGFPINSPSDEYLMIPGTDMGNIMLITNRQGLDSMITAYMLRIHEPRITMAIADPSELRKIGNFGGIEAIPEMVDMSIPDSLAEKNSLSAVALQMDPSKSPKPGEEGGGMPADYQKFLLLALGQQFIADSLARLAHEARIEVKSISDPDERWAIQKNIISWEKGSSDSQAKADEYYVLVKQLEKGNQVAEKIPDTIVKDTVINDIIVYKYKLEDTLRGNPPIQQQLIIMPDISAGTGLSIEGENPDMTRVKATGKTNLFEVLEKSPYSANNPFPEDTIIPTGVYYKIQLAVKSLEPGFDAFGGITPISFEPVTGKPMKKYFAGKFDDYESSKKALEEVRKNGFPEAFIISWYDGRKMTLTKVVELEKK